METRSAGVSAGDYSVARGWVPPWVVKLGMPVWISDPDRHISYLNGRAESLLGLSADRCVGRSCSEVVRGRTAQGKPFCSERCPVVRQLEFQAEIEPIRIRVGIGRRAKWVQVVVIAAQSPDLAGSYMVHCVIDDEREQRFKRYLTKVMTRSPKKRAVNPRVKGTPLTQREKEILALLSDDASLREIANRLHLSYTTVRNHVQHILNKLGVHSTMEAVAYYLLSDDWT
jgi:DNA-binding CsgD family transcriptional regulator